MQFAVVSRPIDSVALVQGVVEAHARAAAGDGVAGPGAVTVFAGVVRNEHAGRRVTHLEYEAYEGLALKAFAQIAGEARTAWPGTAIGIHHRVGRLGVGETSVVIVAVSAHRAEAFAAARFAIERIKQIAPIWKHEHFDGGDVWIEGATADPFDDSARQEAFRRACA